MTKPTREELQFTIGGSIYSDMLNLSICSDGWCKSFKMSRDELADLKDCIETALEAALGDE